jgi:Na+-exporting ATPase
MIHAFECKHFTKGIFQVNLRDNKVLLWCGIVLILGTVSERSPLFLQLPALSIRSLVDDVVPRGLHPHYQQQGLPHRASRVGMGNHREYLISSGVLRSKVRVQTLIRQFGMIFVYLGSTELYKWCKRIYFRRNAHPSNKRMVTDKTLRMEPTIAPV